jgi:hypothetical protein
MYPEEVGEKLKDIASSAMDSTQGKIEQLNSLGSNARARSSDLLLGWQTWLGNISFSLAAIGGAVLIGKDLPNTYTALSLFIFLTTGLWVTLYHKRIFEKLASNASIEADEYRPLYDDKKKAAFMLWEDPRNIQKHIDYLRAEKKIMELTKRIETAQNTDLKKERVSYLNDIWLSMVITAVYFMMYPIGDKAYGKLGLQPGWFWTIFWLIWLLFMLIIVREALASRPNIMAANKGKLQKLKNEMKHTKEYTARINEEIALAEQAQATLT